MATFRNGWIFGDRNAQTQCFNWPTRNYYKALLPGISFSYDTLILMVNRIYFENLHLLFQAFFVKNSYIHCNRILAIGITHMVIFYVLYFWRNIKSVPILDLSTSTKCFKFHITFLSQDFFARWMRRIFYLKPIKSLWIFLFWITFLHSSTKVELIFQAPRSHCIHTIHLIYIHRYEVRLCWANDDLWVLVVVQA